MLVRRLFFSILLVGFFAAVSAGSHSGVLSENVVRNPDFIDKHSETGTPASWQVRGQGHAVGIEAAGFSDGDASLVIRSEKNPRATLVEQELPAGILAHGGRLRGHVKTEDIAVSASLFVVVERNGEKVFADDMRDRPARGTGGWQVLEIAVPPIRDSDTVRIGAIVVGPGVAWFDHLQWIPANKEDNQAMAQEARAYLDKALEILQARHVMSNSINWQVLRSEAYSAAQAAGSIDAAHSILRQVVSRLPDGHSSLVAPGEREAGTFENAETFAKPRMHRDGLHLVLHMPALNAGTDSVKAGEYVSAVIAAINGPGIANACCGAVIDLRSNYGGNMWPMLAALSPLLEADGVGAHVRHDEVSSWWASRGAAGVSVDGRRVTRFSRAGDQHIPDLSNWPVAVLIGPDTASAGEAVAIAFKGREHTRFFGDETGGLTTANAAVKLPDGYRLVFPVAWTADRNGTEYRNTVTPDQRVENSQVPDDVVLRAALKWLNGQHGAALQCHDMTKQAADGFEQLRR